MTKRIKPTKEFIKIVCVGSAEEIQRANPGFSSVWINICQTYARSYKTSPESIDAKYSRMGSRLKKMIRDFVDEYSDLIPTTRTQCAGIKRPRGMKEDSPPKPAIQPEIKSINELRIKKVEPLNNKQTLETVLDLLSNTISTIKMLVEKL